MMERGSAALAVPSAVNERSDFGSLLIVMSGIGLFRSIADTQAS